MPTRVQETAPIWWSSRVVTLLGTYRQLAETSGGVGKTDSEDRQLPSFAEFVGE